MVVSARYIVEEKKKGKQQTKERNKEHELQLTPRDLGPKKFWKNYTNSVDAGKRLTWFV